MHPHTKNDKDGSGYKEVLCQVCNEPVEDQRRKVCSTRCADQRFSAKSTPIVDNLPRDDGRTGGFKRDSSGNERNVAYAHRIPHDLTRPPPAAPARVRFSTLAGPPHPSQGPAHSFGTQPTLQQQFFPLANHGTMSPPPIPSHRVSPPHYGRGTVTYANQQSSARASVPNHGTHDTTAYNTSQQALGPTTPYNPGQAPAYHSGNKQGGEQSYGPRYLPRPRSGTMRERLPSPLPITADKQTDDEAIEEETVKFFSTHYLRIQDRRGRGEGPAGEGERRG